MARPSEAHVEVARRLLTQSCAEGGSPEGPDTVARLYGLLFDTLAPVIGAAGFEALFARSLRLMKSGHPPLEHLRAPELSGDGAGHRAIDQVVATLRQLDAASALPLAVELFAALYGLLATFIGESLVLHLLKGAFPEIDEPGAEEKK